MYSPSEIPFYVSVEAIRCHRTWFVKNNSILEILLIIGIGLAFHIKKMSVFNLEQLDWPVIMPTLPSIVLTLAVLCLSARYRFYYWDLPGTSVLLRCCATITIGIYASQFTLYFLWLPLLAITEFGCLFWAEFFKLAYKKHDYKIIQEFALWCENEAFFVMKAIYVVIFLVIIFKIVYDVYKYLVQKYAAKCNRKVTFSPRTKGKKRRR